MCECRCVCVSLLVWLMVLCLSSISSPKTRCKVAFWYIFWSRVFSKLAEYRVESLVENLRRRNRCFLGLSWRGNTRDNSLRRRRCPRSGSLISSSLASRFSLSSSSDPDDQRLVCRTLTGVVQKTEVEKISSSVGPSEIRWRKRLPKTKILLRQEDAQRWGKQQSCRGITFQSCSWWGFWSSRSAESALYYTGAKSYFVKNPFQIHRI